MYKNDNFMAREDCSEALLRTLIDGRAPERSARQSSPSCDSDGKDTQRTWGLASHPLASVYAPMQEFRDLYDLDTALKQGTIFTELDLPFMGRQIDKGASCRG